MIPSRTGAHRIAVHLCLALIPLAAGVALAWSAAPSMFPFPAYTTGPGPVDIVVVDLNGDGIADVVTADTRRSLNDPPSRGVSVLLGQPGGSFGPPTTFTAGGVAPLLPVAIAVGDFNGDGMLDIALANADPGQPPGQPGPGSMSILLGNGDGTLGSQVHYAAGTGTTSIATGDFDGDGHPDLVVANSVSNDVSVYLGRGDGTFAAQVRYITPALPGGVAVGDFNGDGHADLAVACGQTGVVFVLIGRGDGTLVQPLTSVFGAGAGAFAIAPADLNGDGRLDLVVGNRGSHDLSILLGKGDGTFPTRTSIAAAQTPSRIIIADLDGDGRPDVVEAGSGPANAIGVGEPIEVFRNSGGTFALRDKFGVGADVLGLALAAADRDGHPDLLIPRRQWGDVVVVPGRGDGTFGPKPVSLTSGLSLFPVAAADLNGDHRPDVVVADYNGAAASIFLAGPGGTSFSAPLGVAVGQLPWSITAADLDRDGHSDLVVANSGSGDVSILYGHGDGTFEPQVRIAAGASPERTAVADFDGDGNPDLAVTGAGASYLSFFRGLGGRALGPEVRIPLGGSGIAAFPLAVADFDGDGRPDLAVGGFDLLILSADPSGSLQVRSDTPVGSLVSADLAVGDLNEDGVSDLVLRNFLVPGPTFAVLLGRGDGTFDPPVGFGSADLDNSIAVADFDGDGHLDVAVPPGPGTVDIWRGTGHGDFVRMGRFATGGTGSRLAVADFDADGRPDLAVANQDSTAWVLLNRSPLDAPPVAAAGPDVQAECVSPQGAPVTLDGSLSTDPDSTPGTQDDIASFAWYENRGLPTETSLGAGVRLTVTLPLGTHAITLVVTDKAGKSSADSVTVDVADTQPPSLQLAADPATLWPPNHTMIPVHVSWTAQDRCDPAVRVELLSVQSSEPDDAPGNQDGATTGDIQGAEPGTADGDLLLRSERDGAGPGRIYTLFYRATDGSGNSAPGLATVVVPHDLGQGPEPLLMRLAPSAEGSSAVTIVWPAMDGALGYDLISGSLSSWSLSGETLHLAGVSVLARDATDLSFTEPAGAAIPEPGQATFYLLEPILASGPAGYGTESAPWPRVPDACDGGCP